MKQKVIPKTKENAVELVRGGGINHFFIRTAIWRIIKCEESSAQDVKQKPNSKWMVKQRQLKQDYKW